MKKNLDHAWFNFVRLFQWHRVLGIGGLCVVAYILVFVVFGQSDVSGFLPRPYTPSFHWPNLPQFLVRSDDSKKPETIYTVPTRQITPQELAEIRGAAPNPKPQRATK